MSTLLENKQIIHVASEIVVLTGLTFYFSQKNKKLTGHIEDLAERIEEQEDLLQKHEQVIRKLVEFVNQQKNTQSNNQPTSPTSLRPSTNFKKSKKPKRNKRDKHKEHVSPPLSPPLPVKQEPRVNFSFPISESQDNYNIVSEEYSSENNSDLDAEIEQELGDLDDDVIDFDTQNSLKNTTHI
jgi:hypothetical protein